MHRIARVRVIVVLGKIGDHTRPQIEIRQRSTRNSWMIVIVFEYSVI